MNCKFCGAEGSHVHDLSPVGINAVVCEKCLSDGAKLCDGCGELHFYEKTVFYVKEAGKYLCKECAGDMDTCTKCGTLTGSKSKVGAKVVCPDCIEKLYYRCSCCNKLKLKTAKTSKLDLARFSSVLPKDGDVCRACFRKQTKGVTPNEIYECHHCKEFTGTKYKTREGELPFCSTCASEKLLSCGCCSEVFYYGDTYRLAESNGKVICNPCKQEHYFRCRVCGGYHRKADGVPFKKYLLCESCSKKVYTCDHCEEAFLGTPNTKGGKKYCDHCISLWNTCSYCNKEGFEVEEVENGQHTYACLACRTRHKLFQIKRWNHVPRRLNFTGKGKLFFGVEVELSAGQGDRMEICRHFASLGNPNMYIKHDGSIDNGVEIVMHPTTFDEFGKMGFDKLFNCPEIKPSKSCGTHVHMSRDAFTPLHLFKFMKFFHLMQPEIEKLAGRTYDYTNYKTGRQYCKKTEEHEIPEFIDGKLSDKYREVRLNCENTIEVRVFSGVTTAAEMYRCVEFCHAVFHYTRDLSNADSANWVEFQAFVNKERASYPNLYNYFSK